MSITQILGMPDGAGEIRLKLVFFFFFLANGFLLPQLLFSEQIFVLLKQGIGSKAFAFSGTSA